MMRLPRQAQPSVCGHSHSVLAILDTGALDALERKRFYYRNDQSHWVSIAGSQSLTSVYTPSLDDRSVLNIYFL